MNIFYLDENIDPCARAHTDKHVVKMILEYGQLLSSAHHFHGSVNASKMYKLTHKNHPCAVWVRESHANYWKLFDLFYALHREYMYRYNRVHATFSKLSVVAGLNPCPHGPLTPLPICMPDEFKVDGNVVESYRNYYRVGKAHLHKWTGRSPPDWI